MYQLRLDSVVIVTIAQRLYSLGVNSELVNYFPSTQANGYNVIVSTARFVAYPVLQNALNKPTVLTLHYTLNEKLCMRLKN